MESKMDGSVYSWSILCLLYRYIDDVFMTSNMSIDKIRAKLDWMNEKDGEHIRITHSVGFKVEFLDVQIIIRSRIFPVTVLICGQFRVNFFVLATFNFCPFQAFRTLLDNLLGQDIKSHFE